ncbi:MAG TPA: hypothetical protein VHM23_31360 [Actinomycetota bacterium]|nr:hypothetical protein [Actinomycetota bacterium]
MQDGHDAAPARTADSSEASWAGSVPPASSPAWPASRAASMVAIEGENQRPVTWVIVEEVRSGDWGIAGNPLTTGDVKALAAGSPIA